MEGTETVIAAGLGCRQGCAAHELLAAVDRALARADKRRSDIHALYAPSFKHAEPGLAEAAVELARPLVLLELSVLRCQSPHVLTQSAQVLLRFGVPSIAETAALAGACTFASVYDTTHAAHVARAPHEPRARLLGPRQQSGGATCALAELDSHWTAMERSL
jgi:cobalt-precorrin 5A hydrolase